MWLSVNNTTRSCHGHTSILSCKKISYFCKNFSNIIVLRLHLSNNYKYKAILINMQRNNYTPLGFFIQCTVKTKLRIGFVKVTKVVWLRGRKDSSINLMSLKCVYFQLKIWPISLRKCCYIIFMGNVEIIFCKKKNNNNQRRNPYNFT